jgi:serine/threonine protein kinase/class 3 adenylate cyclase
MNLGSYQLLAQIGTGDDGVSYRASDADGAPVEIRLLSGARGDAARWKVLSKRVRLAAAVAHPSALRLLELNLQHDPPFLVAEWLEGKILSAALADRLPLPAAEALALVQNLAAALAEAHRLGLAHGSLSPGHLRCDNRGVPKLDFSGTDTWQASPDNLEVLDTLVLAPEARASANPGLPADVYCLGALLFWLISGRALAGSLTEEAVQPLRAALPNGDVTLERVVRDMVATEPTDRPTAREVADRLSALAGMLKVSNGQSSMLAQSAGGWARADTPHVSDGPAAPPREKLGRYRLLEKLGQGGMGAVYRAEDTGDASIVAIKVLREEVAERPESRRRFHKEARLLSEVRHPNVANLLEINEDDGVRYLVLEYVAGKSLDKHLGEQGKLDERSGLAIMAEVARALEDAHQRGIVHRDIKPANIVLVNAEGERARGAVQVKLLDFGLARHVVESTSLDVTKTGATLGTPLYMAPEQWAGNVADPRTDVYALGGTLFHTLAGQPPFVADNPTALLALHCNEAAPALPKINAAISDAVGQIVAKCLAKRPEERYADAGALLRDLERVLRGEPSSIVVHPRLPGADPKRVFEFNWVWDLQAPPELLWSYVSNTERFNRAVGIPAPDFTSRANPHGGTRRFGRFRKAGFNNVWQEHPFEWIEGRKFGVLREYSEGVFKWLVSMTELEPRGSGTRLYHRVRIEPRGLMGRFVASFEVGVRARRVCEQVYQRIDAFLTNRLQGGVRADPFEEGAKLSAAQRRQLDRLANQLTAKAIDPLVAEALVDFLGNAPAPEVARIRPLALARRLKLDPEQVVAACLHAANLGLLVLLWDILCPICRIPSEIKDSLKALRDHGRCEACNLDFELDFANAVELIFRVHPDIRATDLGTYCIGGPVHFPHVVAQARLAAGERMEFALSLGEGNYRLRGPQLPWVVEFGAQPEASIGHWEVRLQSGSAAPFVPALRSGRQVLAVSNEQDHEVLVRVERTTPRADVLTAARASAQALFRELFPTEILAPGQLVSVATMTFLVTHLEQARRLYQDLGDARAFALIHEHFRVLEQSIRRGGGALVKVNGEGILAAFSQSPAAVRTALDVFASLAENETTRSLQLRAGIHRGPAMATTIQDHLDYFGTTVHAAEQLVNLAAGGEIVLTYPVASDPQVAAVVRERGIEAEIMEADVPGQKIGVAHRLKVTAVQSRTLMPAPSVALVKRS